MRFYETSTFKWSQKRIYLNHYSNVAQNIKLKHGLWQKSRISIKSHGYDLLKTFLSANNAGQGQKWSNEGKSKAWKMSAGHNRKASIKVVRPLKYDEHMQNSSSNLNLGSPKRI